MRFGIRQEIDLADFSKYLDPLQGIPIELALPHRIEDYFKSRRILDDLERYIRQKGVVCQSIHAPQGRISDEYFMSWAEEVVLFAEMVGAEIVVFHPEQCRPAMKANCQSMALVRIRKLQEQTSVTIGIETFGGERRIFRPLEIIEFQLPMVLDVSHVTEEESRELIKRSLKSIVAIHLSAIGIDPQTGEDGHHLPVNDFCIEILNSLNRAAWKGPVTLEYLPWHHDKLLKDRELLEKRYSKSVKDSKKSWS